MIRTILLAAVCIIAVKSYAQVNDPMITNWWFNTTNNTYKGILTDVEAVYYTSQYVYVKSSGVPNYYQDGQSVNNASDLNAVWQIPRVPQPATNHQGVQGGQTGLMLDGSVFFHPGDAQSYNNAGVWNRLAYYFENQDMDASNGHSTPTNMYHHHFDNLQLHDWDATKHSPIVGFAWDGYPVYGPYGYANTDGTGGIQRMRSSYATKSYTTRTNGPNVNAQYPIGCFIEDWQYTAGSGDLDEYNGRFCITPEYPNGTYAYFTTVDANLKPCYPYFIGPTYYGTFSNTNIGPNGGKATIPSNATTYSPITNVDDINTIEEQVKIFPVPVTDYLNVALTGNKPYTIVLYDVKGRVLQVKETHSSDRLDMSGLSYGIYFVEITCQKDKSGFVKRIVKQ